MDEDATPAASDSPSASLLPPTESPPTHDIQLCRKGTLRAYYLGAVVCIGGFLFGYDSGIIGGVLTLASFEADLRYPSNERARVSSLAVCLQNLGAFVSCFLIWPLTRRHGRKWAIVLSSIVFCLGAFFQTLNFHSLQFFYLSRVVAGLGLGASSVVVPMYSSEMVPKHLRGQIGSFYQLFFTFGIFTSYWVDYAVAEAYSGTSSHQWQVPIGLQLVPGIMLGLGVLTLKESTRWLTLQGRHQEAWQALVWIRASDGPEVEAEMEEIRSGVAFERSQSEGLRLSELITVPSNLKKVLTAVAIFTAQQATGATAFAYYGPQYFELLVGDKKHSDLLLTVFFGVIKVVSCSIFVVFVAERVSRRGILLGGALVMAACQLCTAAVSRSHPARGDGTITGSGIATIALIYLFVIAYNFSWGPLPWPCASEIFPTRIREAGMGVGVASQWLFNLVFTFSTPYMIRNWKWGTFVFWGMSDLIIAIGTWSLLVETRGRSLEDISRTADRPGKVKR